ncbi:glutamate receptor-interacting protein 1-like isoform X1 [Petromyzon marinus]|uniref:glutamate receptor-interacting protein 1-like isoform X1 n=1 Tax=Petromyzon marinus TaxID=7757 RepID=UPI003F702E9B
MITVSFKCRFRMLKGVIKDEASYARGGAQSQPPAVTGDASPPSHRQGIPEDCKGTVTVELVKKEGSSLGLTVSGGADKDSKPRVSSLRAGGVAAKSDQLCVGDYLHSVNGIHVSRLRHEEIVSLLRSIGERALLEVEYPLPPPALDGTSVVHKTIEIALHKDGNSFGFVVRGGVQSDKKKSRPIVVSHVRQGGPADRDGTLKAGDRLLAVEGIPVQGLSLCEASVVLKQSGQDARVLVEYDVSVMESVQNATGPLLVEIRKTSGANLGISLSKESCGMKQIFVIDKIRPASIAERCGALHVGDRILSVDGSGVEQMSVEEASVLLACSGSSGGDGIKLEILPSLAPRPTGTAPDSGVVVDVDASSHLEASAARVKDAAAVSCRPPIPPRHLRHRTLPTPSTSSASDHVQSLGSLQLATLPYPTSPGGSLPRRAHAATSPPSGGTLPRMRHPSSAGAAAAAAAPPGLYPGGPGGTFPRTHQPSTPGGSLPRSMCTSSPSGSLPRSLRSATSDSTLPRGFSSASACSTVSRTYCPVSPAGSLNRRKLWGKDSRSSSCSTLGPGGQVVHTESVALHLASDGGPGFGLHLQGGTFSTDVFGAPLLIGYIEPDSPAERCGLLQPGDRILSVNGIPTAELGSLAEVSQYLHEQALVGSASLEVEFDVAESVIPSSGTFHVTLPKKKGVELGITITSPTHRKPSEPLVITEIKKGSVAHRLGTLEPGDRLLAINHTRLETSSVDETVHILQQSDDFVKLKVRKDEDNSDEQEASGAISYSVELRRHGGPLGITISGTDEPTDPILIASLTPDGLAERTGAIHVGDQILAIDGMSLKGKPLSEAIALLQRAGEIVALKIKKRTADGGKEAPGTLGDVSDSDEDDGGLGSARPSRLYPGALTPGLDSALGSWDGSATNSSRHSHSVKDEPSSSPSVHTAECSGNDATHRDGSSLSGKSPAAAAAAASPGLMYFGRRYSAGSDSEGHFLPRKHEVVDVCGPSAALKDMKVTLHRRDSTEDFGFSVSDGLLEKGVFVTSVRLDGPAERDGLRPFDRIVEVNGVQLGEAGCGSLVPLVSESRDSVELLVSRVQLPCTIEGRRTPTPPPRPRPPVPAPPPHLRCKPAEPWVPGGAGRAADGGRSSPLALSCLPQAATRHPDFPGGGGGDDVDKGAALQPFMPLHPREQPAGAEHHNNLEML